jgi:uncharacterized DUF497 family protein
VAIYNSHKILKNDVAFQVKAITFTTMFEYDPAKSASNKVKHGIDFVEAQKLWTDRNAMVFPVSHSVEDRYILLAVYQSKM